MIYSKIKDTLRNLDTPTVTTVKNFDDFLAELIADAKEVLGRDWRPLESDPYMKHLRVMALRKLHDQTNKNIIIRDLLVTTATGDMLDHLGVSRGVVRDEGEFPIARFEFKLSTPLDRDVVIPQGTILTSDTNIQSETIEDGLISAGNDKVVVKVQLFEYVESSDIQTPYIVTELPFVATATQLESFHNGADVENDDRYRLRIITALARSSTAGAEDAYRWYAFSADRRIKDVCITSIPKSLIVDIYVYAKSDMLDDEMIERVYSTCNAKSVRPLSDLVQVHKATIIPVTIKATLEVYDLLKASSIQEQIEENFRDSFGLGVDLVKSDFDRKCHVDGVYRVVNDFEDILVDKHEVIEIQGFELEFVGVENV